MPLYTKCNSNSFYIVCATPRGRGCRGDKMHPGLYYGSAPVHTSRLYISSATVSPKLYSSTKPDKKGRMLLVTFTDPILGRKDSAASHAIPEWPAQKGGRGCRDEQKRHRSRLILWRSCWWVLVPCTLALHGKYKAPHPSHVFDRPIHPLWNK
jgi:hypothetical protein